MFRWKFHIKQSLIIGCSPPDKRLARRRDLRSKLVEFMSAEALGDQNWPTVVWWRGLINLCAPITIPPSPPPHTFTLSNFAATPPTSNPNGYFLQFLVAKFRRSPGSSDCRAHSLMGALKQKHGHFWDHNLTVGALRAAGRTMVADDKGVIPEVTPFLEIYWHIFFPNAFLVKCWKM